MLNLQADTLPIALPGDWSEMTLGQFVAYRLAVTDEEIIAALSGVSLGSLRTQQHIDYSPAFGMLDYLQQIPDFTALAAPGGLELPDRRVSLQGLAESLTLGQSEDLKAAAKRRIDQDLPTDYASMAIDLLAISLYDRVTGKDYPDKADRDQVYSITELLGQAPLMQALPLAYHLRGWYDHPPVAKHVVFVPLKGKTPTRWESIRTWLLWLRTYLPFYKPNQLTNG